MYTTHGKIQRRGVLHQIFGKRVQHIIQNWTESDLRFRKNEGSKRFKINGKGVQLDRKSRRKLIQNASKLLDNTFWWNIRPTLGSSISGTKCDRGKLIFSAERGCQSDRAIAWNRDNRIVNLKKVGVITTEPHCHAQIWDYPPRG